MNELRDRVEEWNEVVRQMRFFHLDEKKTDIDGNEYRELLMAFVDTSQAIFDCKNRTTGGR